MVIPRAVAQQNQFASAVADVEPQLVPEVVRIRYTLGNDWSGEPAVFFRVVLTNDASKRDRLFEVTSRVSSLVERQIEPLEQWGVLPYFTFRSQLEQDQLREPAWA